MQVIFSQPEPKEKQNAFCDCLSEPLPLLERESEREIKSLRGIMSLVKINSHEMKLINSSL